MTNIAPSRRSVLIGAAAAAATAALPGRGARAAGSMTVGFIYVGSRDDYGYNQSHAEGAAVVRKMPGLTVVEQERVPETVACARSDAALSDLLRLFQPVHAQGGQDQSRR
jgi:basic membrane protein A